MIVTKAGFWFLIECDQFELNVYYFRIVYLNRRDVGKPFHMNIIHAQKVPLNPFALCGTFNINFFIRACFNPSDWKAQAGNA